MEFEFDPNKSEANRQKHRIDFVEAQVLWHDVNALEIPARTEDEPRSIVIGKIKNALWAAIVTQREGRTRIISVRHARDEERDLYES